jgi:uncharacterized SAM-binding protein YcdF (DUF218 family)
MKFQYLLLVGVGLFLAFAFGDFQRRLGKALPQGPHPDVAVVFTGQFNRVELALALFEKQQLDRVFVSGVNPPAGIHHDSFSRQFAVSPAVKTALASGRIALGTEAHSTLDNALETACWMTQSPEIRDLILITGRAHMPRASLALERATAPELKIVRVSPDHEDRPQPAYTEFAKFLVTWMVTLMPMSFWPGTASISCST